MIKEKELYLALLAQKKIQGTLTEKETTFLNRWLAESPDHQEYFNALIEDFTIMEELKIYNNVDSDDMWQRTMNRIQQLPPEPVALFTWKKLLVAAVILGVVSTIGYWVYTSNTHPPNRSSVATVPAIDKHTDPDYRISLTLADGSTINLRDQPEGFEQTQGKVKVKVLKKDSLIQFLPATNAAAAAIYGTSVLSVSPGGKYQVLLPDGSRIWLNADTKLTIPVQSPDSMRSASISGEAYCEITPNARYPFELTTRNARIQVLGTKFNVNAYDNEKDSRISLIQGKIDLYTTVTTNNTTRQSLIPTTMTPGDRAIVDGNGKVTKASGNNLDADIDWKYNNMNFVKRPIDQIARAVGRRFGLAVTLQSAAVSGHEATVQFRASHTLPDIIQGLNDYYNQYNYAFKYDPDQATLLVTTTN